MLKCLKHTTQSCLLFCSRLLSTCTWLSLWFIFANEETYSWGLLLLELSTVCDFCVDFCLSEILLIIIIIINIYIFAFKGFLWQWFSIFEILDLASQFTYSSLHPKTAFLDNSGCLPASWSCLFPFLWDNESLSYPVTVSRQDIVLSCILNSSVFFSSTSKLHLRPERKWIWQLLKQFCNIFVTFSTQKSFNPCSYSITRT